MGMVRRGRVQQFEITQSLYLRALYLRALCQATAASRPRAFPEPLSGDEVANTVTVAVLKGPRIDLEDDAILPPVRPLQATPPKLKNS
jgi:hypothetical protein